MSCTLTSSRGGIRGRKYGPPWFLLPKENWNAPNCYCEFQDCGKELFFADSKTQCHRCSMTLCQACTRKMEFPLSSCAIKKTMALCPRCYQVIASIAREQREMLQSPKQQTPRIAKDTWQEDNVEVPCHPPRLLSGGKVFPHPSSSGSFSEHSTDLLTPARNFLTSKAYQRADNILSHCMSGVTAATATIATTVSPHYRDHITLDHLNRDKGKTPSIPLARAVVSASATKKIWGDRFGPLDGKRGTLWSQRVEPIKQVRKLLTPYNEDMEEEDGEAHKREVGVKEREEKMNHVTPLVGKTEKMMVEGTAEFIDSSARLAEELGGIWRTEIPHVPSFFKGDDIDKRSSTSSCTPEFTPVRATYVSPPVTRSSDAGNKVKNNSSSTPSRMMKIPETSKREVEQKVEGEDLLSDAAAYPNRKAMEKMMTIKEKNRRLKVAGNAGGDASFSTFSPSSALSPTSTNAATLSFSEAKAKGEAETAYLSPYVDHPMHSSPPLPDVGGGPSAPADHPILTTVPRLNFDKLSQGIPFSAEVEQEEETTPYVGKMSRTKKEEVMVDPLPSSINTLGESEWGRNPRKDLQIRSEPHADLTLRQKEEYLKHWEEELSMKESSVLEFLWMVQEREREFEQYMTFVENNMEQLIDAHCCFSHQVALFMGDEEERL